MQVTVWEIVVSKARENTTVNGTHLAVVLDSKVECESGDPLRLVPRHDLQALYNTGVGLDEMVSSLVSSLTQKQTYLVLQSRVLSLRVLTNDGKVDVLVASGETGKSLAEDEGGVDVELLPHRYVPRTVTRPLLGGVQNTCGVGLSACERTRGE